MKKRMALLLCLVMLLTLLAGCSGGTSDKTADTNKTAAALETVEISYWIPVGEDSTYYLSYEENPAVKYLETLEFAGKRIDLKFTIPITGKELDNFNTLLMTDEYSSLMDMGSSTTYASELLEDGYILNKETLAMMKPAAFVINMARGALIDEAALVEALRGGVIAGAGLDTFEKEPLPADSPLWDLPNVMITPHITPRLPDREERALEYVYQNIDAYRTGGRFVNRLTERDLYTKGRSGRA